MDLLIPTGSDKGSNLTRFRSRCTRTSLGNWICWEFLCDSAVLRREKREYPAPHDV